MFALPAHEQCALFVLKPRDSRLDVCHAATRRPLPLREPSQSHRERWRTGHVMLTAKGGPNAASAVTYPNWGAVLKKRGGACRN